MAKQRNKGSLVLGGLLSLYREDEDYTASRVQLAAMSLVVYYGVGVPIGVSISSPPPLQSRRVGPRPAARRVA